MKAVPTVPKIYHIVHVDRLTSIIEDNHLWCDSKISKRKLPGTTIGMGEIKERRLNRPVECRPGTYVGDYVPFYFCPRSVMLYVIHQRNHPELTYRDGQKPIVHLETDLNKVVAWADEDKRRWAFSLSNAAANYAEFRSRLDQLNEINWQAIKADSWSDVKEEKQAEFLVHERFPWRLVSRIGVHSSGIFKQARHALESAQHKPRVEIKRDWYY